MSTTTLPDYADELASSLIWDRDTYEAPDGSRWRLRYEPDEGMTINDFECYGKIKWGRRNNTYGGSDRPEGFTGAARIIRYDMHDALWWEPYREGHKVYDSPADVALVRDICEYGFQVMILERFSHCDCCHNEEWDVVGVLGGIEPIRQDPENTKSNILEMLYEAD